MLGGCMPQQNAATESQKANRAYMSEVNQTMSSLDEGLGAFVDAVSRDDVVNMRTQADNACKAIDKLDDIDVPDDMKDIHKKYVEGADKMEQALNAYIALYTEIQQAKAGGSFDWSAYNERLAEVQGLYDEGYKALKDADETAASKK
jgi:uncharacterized phage infection (PIP) family protein YhgE